MGAAGRRVVPDPTGSRWGLELACWHLDQEGAWGSKAPAVWCGSGWGGEGPWASPRDKVLAQGHACGCCIFQHQTGSETLQGWPTAGDTALLPQQRNSVGRERRREAGSAVLHQETRWPGLGAPPTAVGASTGPRLRTRRQDGGPGSLAHEGKGHLRGVLGPQSPHEPTFAQKWKLDG